MEILQMLSIGLLSLTITALIGLVLFYMIINLNIKHVGLALLIIAASLLVGWIEVHFLF